MRREHPLWRGFWLACVWTAALVTLGGADALAAFRGTELGLILAGATLAGGFLADLPRRLRHRGKTSARPRLSQLLTAFFCGLAMALALGMAGSGRILPALLEGSTGAYAFVAAAAAAAFVAARIAGRRNAA